MLKYHFNILNEGVINTIFEQCELKQKLFNKLKRNLAYKYLENIFNIFNVDNQDKWQIYQKNYNNRIINCISEQGSYFDLEFDQNKITYNNKYITKGIVYKRNKDNIVLDYVFLDSHKEKNGNIIEKLYNKENKNYCLKVKNENNYIKIISSYDESIFNSSSLEIDEFLNNIELPINIIELYQNLRKYLKKDIQLRTYSDKNKAIDNKGFSMPDSLVISKGILSDICVCRYGHCIWLNNDNLWKYSGPDIIADFDGDNLNVQRNYHILNEEFSDINKELSNITDAVKRVRSKLKDVQKENLG